MYSMQRYCLLISTGDYIKTAIRYANAFDTNATAQISSTSSSSAALAFLVPLACKGSSGMPALSLMPIA